MMQLSDLAKKLISKGLGRSGRGSGPLHYLQCEYCKRILHIPGYGEDWVDLITMDHDKNCIVHKVYRVANAKD